MNKAKNRLILYSVAVVFVLLSVLVGVINGIDFTMAANDADHVTEMLAREKGRFGPRPKEPGNFGPDRMGPMGPDSPETSASLRYFTYAFDMDGEGTQVAFNISAVSEEEALEWANSLVKETTGWTRGTYRYRVYQREQDTYVTVIDQGRELLPCFRILVISLVGEVLAIVIMALFLIHAGNRLFAPLADADRKQKQFIAGINQEFLVPLSVINADAELLERKHGMIEETNSIRRQVKHMSELLKRLDHLAVFVDGEKFKSILPLHEFMQSEIDQASSHLQERNIRVECDIDPNASLKANPEDFKRIFGELADNAGKYAKTHARFALKKVGERILIECSNDTDLPDGSYDQAFDRFTTLANSLDGLGLGLSGVKETMRQYNGRCSVNVKNGIWTLTLSL